MHHLRTFMAAAIVAAMAGVAPARDEIIVFTQPKASPLAHQFQTEELPRLRELARQMDMRLRVVDAGRKGAPPDVGITPLIVFQNHLGRSIYQGRYADHGRLGNFLGTARRIPQGPAGVEMADVPIWRTGRAVVGAPIKVTPMEGEVPAGLNDVAFERGARAAIAAGFTDFSLAATHSFGRSDRLFYMDFYPIAVEGDQLVVSLALFSQFDCHEPIFTAYNDEVIGPLAESAPLFGEAAALLEAEVKRQVAASPRGDGFDALPESTRVRSWEKLGLKLPKAPRTATATPRVAGPVPTQWVIVPPAAGEAVGQFRFPAPLDSYSGRIMGASAELGFAADGEVSTASGFISVPSRLVTMGDSALDDTVFDSIAADQFPEARFEIVSAAAAPGSLRWGEAAPLFVDGDFTMKGLPIPVQVRAELTPGVGSEGDPRLFVTASFRIRLGDPFQIEGPPGPAEASDTLEFHMDFTMQPKP